MVGTSKTTKNAEGKARASKGAKRAIEAWEKDGDREDQDYYHIPGSPKLDHTEAHTRGQKPRKS